MCLFKRNHEDKKKKYKITFQKDTYDFQYNSLGSSWKEISDSVIFEALYKLKEKTDLDFEIISIKIQDSNYTSKIIIKCKKEYKNLILFGFCSLLKNRIKNVSIK